MRQIEGMSIEGWLKITKVYEDRSEVVFDRKNLITKAAKQFLLTALFLNNVVSDPIKTLHAGIGGAIDPNGLYPKNEDPLATGLSNEIISVPVAYTTDLNEISVTFLADIDQTQANGQLITEAGLFKDSGDIFNIKNHPGILKTSEFSIHYEWRIKYL